MWKTGFIGCKVYFIFVFLLKYLREACKIIFYVSWSYIVAYFVFSQDKADVISAYNNEVTI